MDVMTTKHDEPAIPELTLDWRLRMAAAWADKSRDDMAREMDVAASTISRWCAGKGAPPKRPYVVQWAMATGVDLDWLLTGNTPVDNGPDGGGLVATHREPLTVLRAA